MIQTKCRKQTSNPVVTTLGILPGPSVNNNELPMYLGASIRVALLDSKVPIPNCSEVCFHLHVMNVCN